MDDDYRREDDEYEDIEHRSVIIYDPQTDRWTRSTPLPRARFAPRAINHAGEIVVVGDGLPLRFAGEMWVYLPRDPETFSCYDPEIRASCVGSVSF